MYKIYYFIICIRYIILSYVSDILFYYIYQVYYFIICIRYIILLYVSDILFYYMYQIYYILLLKLVAVLTFEMFFFQVPARATSSKAPSILKVDMSKLTEEEKVELRRKKLKEKHKQKKKEMKERKRDGKKDNLVEERSEKAPVKLDLGSVFDRLLQVSTVQFSLVKTSTGVR